ncbi:MAG TPA: Lrp/AsnC family transcriptional regulator [Acidimicrobiales bacterium]|nr:Lrp/AsnC family transcriptional regulator [Acidimicrobiales bacterium]
MLRDELDRKIIASLVENGRITYAELGQQIGLSTPAVKRRIDKLVASGVIQGFTALVDPAALGDGTEAFVELQCRTKTAPSEIRAMVAEHPEVVAAYTITGDSDALLHLRTAGIQELEAVVERIRLHPNAERTNSRIVLSRLVHRPSA